MDVLDNLSSTESFITPIKFECAEQILERGKASFIQSYVDQQSQLAAQIARSNPRDQRSAIPTNAINSINYSDAAEFIEREISGRREPKRSKADKSDKSDKNPKKVLLKSESMTIKTSKVAKTRFAQRLSVPSIDLAQSCTKCLEHQRFIQKRKNFSNGDQHNSSKSLTTDTKIEQKSKYFGSEVKCVTDIADSNQKAGSEVLATEPKIVSENNVDAQTDGIKIDSSIDDLKRDAHTPSPTLHTDKKEVVIHATLSPALIQGDVDVWIENAKFTKNTTEQVTERKASNSRFRDEIGTRVPRCKADFWEMVDKFATNESEKECDLSSLESTPFRCDSRHIDRSYKNVDCNSHEKYDYSPQLLINHTSADCHIDRDTICRSEYSFANDDSTQDEDSDGVLYQNHEFVNRSRPKSRSAYISSQQSFFLPHRLYQ